MFIGVILDYPETPTLEGDDEANEDNNDAWFEIIFDCKGKVHGTNFFVNYKMYLSKFSNNIIFHIRFLSFYRIININYVYHFIYIWPRLQMEAGLLKNLPHQNGIRYVSQML